jgi:acyl-CoA reductase-like NAD-dependent aldehyde dehydrogenase
MSSAAHLLGETHWIGGAAAPSHNSHSIPIVNPADEAVLARVPSGCEQDVAAAVAAAREAFPAWAGLAPGARAAQLREAGRRMLECRADTALLLTQENGKPLPQALGEVDATLTMLQTITELGSQLSARHLPSGAGDLVFQRREPRGVAACISTWNAPVFASVELAVCNLVVGNTVVLKSSEKTPLATRFLFERMFAHLPAGVVNHLCGDGPRVGEPLMKSPGIDVVCFIGSVRVGRQIGKAAGERIRKVILELGGNDSLIIDDTVDLDAAARLASRCAFANSGQICTSTERIYVLRNVFDEFVERLVAVAQRLRVGPGVEPGIDLGPLIDATQLGKVKQHVDEALAQGAQLRSGGQQLQRPGFFYPPTVLTNVRDDMAVMREETFGPIAPVAPVDSFEEAIERSNESEYGLSAIVFTESAPRAVMAVEKLKAGMIKINSERGQAPGAPAEPMKASGLGFGHGVEFLCELTTTKSVHWRARLT